MARIYSAPGWCPFAEAMPAPLSNYQQGRGGTAIGAVVLHVMDSTFESAVRWFADPRAQTSAHFSISKMGRIVQHVSILDMAYANGLSGYTTNGVTIWRNARGKRVYPTWPGVIVGVNPNRQTVSIEHEGKPGDVWTTAMRAANARLLRWIREQTALEYVPLQTLIGHCHLDTADRPYCPGPTVDYALVAQSGNYAAPAGPYVPVGEWVRLRSAPVLRPDNIVQIATVNAPLTLVTWIAGDLVNGDARWGVTDSGLCVHNSVIREVTA